MSFRRFVEIVCFLGEHEVRNEFRRLALIFGWNLGRFRGCRNLEFLESFWLVDEVFDEMKFSMISPMILGLRMNFVAVFLFGLERSPRIYFRERKS